MKGYRIKVVAQITINVTKEEAERVKIGTIAKDKTLYELVK